MTKINLGSLEIRKLSIFPLKFFHLIHSYNTAASYILWICVFVGAKQLMMSQTKCSGKMGFLYARLVPPPAAFNDWTLNGQGERQGEQHLSSDYYKLFSTTPPQLLRLLFKVIEEDTTPLNIFRYLLTELQH